MGKKKMGNQKENEKGIVKSAAFELSQWNPRKPYHCAERL